MTERQNIEWKRSWQDEYLPSKAGYIDSWGRGIEKITNASTEYGCTAPIFEATPTGIQVTLLPKFKMPSQVAPQDGTSQQAHEAPVTAPVEIDDYVWKLLCLLHEQQTNPQSIWPKKPTTPKRHLYYACNP